MANFLKHVLAALGGIGVVGFAVYWLLALVADWYGPRFVRSDEDIGQIHVVFLIIEVLSMIAGAVLGISLHRRWDKRTARL